MKTRTALIYFVVLVALAGYFYYFEVVRRQARVEQEEAGHRLFQVEKTQITALNLEKPVGDSISLEKKDHWRITVPIDTRADEFSVNSLLSGLQTVKTERQVEEAAQDLKPYGLDQPRLNLAFLAKTKWHHLRLGSKTPVGDNIYASGDQEHRVVLISSSAEQPFNKTLFDLRSKELFTLKREDVDRIELERSNDNLVFVRGDGDHWQAVDAPAVKIKSSKVDSLLSRLFRLRPSRFLDNSDPTQIGLAPPKIRVRLSAKEKSETLLLGDLKETEGIYAKSGQLPTPALVDEDLLDDLPSAEADLEDRTLLAFTTEQVTGLALQLDNRKATLERQGEGWHSPTAGDQKDPETWQVNSLLWKLQGVEYEPPQMPQEQSPPDTAALHLMLFSENHKKIAEIQLPEIPLAETETGTLWLSKSDAPSQPFQVDGESLRDLYESVTQLLPSGS